jgi:hypothetical protein
MNKLPDAAIEGILNYLSMKDKLAFILTSKSCYEFRYLIRCWATLTDLTSKGLNLTLGDLMYISVIPVCRIGIMQVDAQLTWWLMSQYEMCESYYEEDVVRTSMTYHEKIFNIQARSGIGSSDLIAVVKKIMDSMPIRFDFKDVPKKISDVFFS